MVSAAGWLFSRKASGGLFELGWVDEGLFGEI